MRFCLFSAFPLQGEEHASCTVVGETHDDAKFVLAGVGEMSCSEKAFDLLFCDGKDWRREALMDGKQELRRLLSRAPADSQLKYGDHVDGTGTALFHRVCKLDFEGIVAKQKYGPYVTDRETSTWFKIRNREYSQIVGREELFERERHREPVL